MERENFGDKSDILYQHQLLSKQMRENQRENIDARSD